MRRGFTLIEMLVAMAITLIMMGAVVTLFGTVGNSISDSRATMESSERLRNARNILQNDLANFTVTVQPPRGPEGGEGYLEIVEGSDNDMIDMTPYPPPTPIPSGWGLRGDADDILAFTAKSRGEPFIAQVGGVTVQSWTAEIIYFTVVAPGAATLTNEAGTSFQLKTLYRRIILVSPSTVVGAVSGRTVAQYQAAHDLAVRIHGTDFIASTLGDLTKREHRFAHNPSGFPFAITTPVPALTGARLGEDVLLTNVLAFDVKAFDPSVALRYADVNSNNLIDANEPTVVPSDAGYASGLALGLIGAYVDLNFSSYVTPSTTSDFSGPGAQTGLPGVYDTWSTHYESNGINESSTGTDSGSNGLDDDTDGVVDEPDEADAPPPYNVPLRGIQIKIRVYEPDSRQVREVTVVQDFMPQ
jgi:prepilin-type N-terminal cleavage/methylation domain-containing protein